MAESGKTTVDLVYLARLREAFGTTGEQAELPIDVATVADLRVWLGRRGGAWATELAQERAVRFAVNHELAGPGTRIASGDEVAVFPPVTGG